MHDYATTQNRICSREAQPIEHALVTGNALRAGLQVAEIARMMLRVSRGTVRHLGRVKMASSRGEIGGGAISLFVNMESVRSGR